MDEKGEAAIMLRKNLPARSRALTVLRSALGWSQTELAHAAGTRPNVISDYERGQKPLSQGRLEELARCMGFTPEAVAQALEFVDDMSRAVEAPESPGNADLRHVEGIATEVERLAGDFVRTVLNRITIEGRALAARQQARHLWAALKGRKPAERLALVEDAKELRNWALCDLLCTESVKAAGDSANRASEWAGLALRVAELVPGEVTWRWRLQGYAWAHVANARRVGGDLPGAEEAFARAGRLWSAGEPGDPGLLDEAQVLSLEASLRTSQCRLAEADALLERALTADRGALRANLFLKRGRLLEWMGDYEGALTVLSQAASLISEKSELRQWFALRFNIAWNLTHVGRYAEAETRLPEVRTLTVRLANELDALRLRWLEGRVTAGLGRTDEALEAFYQVRAGFADRGIAYDAALVTLELAVLHLDQRRTREVKVLARQMAPIFKAQGVHREALAALKLFCEAAEKEAATVELARQIVDFLYRAQHNPQLRFDADR